MIASDVPIMLGSVADDNEESDSGENAGSANSEQMLEDLDKLSKFMMERKRSSKSKRGMQSRTSSGGGGGGGGSTPGAVAFGGPGPAVPGGPVGKCPSAVGGFKAEGRNYFVWGT